MGSRPFPFLILLFALGSLAKILNSTWLVTQSLCPPQSVSTPFSRSLSSFSCNQARAHPNPR